MRPEAGAEPKTIKTLFAHASPAFRPSTRARDPLPYLNSLLLVENFPADKVQIESDLCRCDDEEPECVTDLRGRYDVPTAQRSHSQCDPLSGPLPIKIGVDMPLGIHWPPSQDTGFRVRI